MPESQKLSAEKMTKRPIDKLGIEQSHDVGRALAALDVNPDVIISSPLRRATQTAAIVANELGYEDKLITDPALRPEASYESLKTCFAATAAETRLWWSATIPV